MTGLYVHIPFCIKKCSYCDFYSIPYSRSLAERYVTRLVKEVSIFSTHAGGGTFINIDTLYVGGGTPSLLDVSQFQALTESLSDNFDLKGLKEFTIEVNPGTVSPYKLKTYREGGANRISIGAQSFDDRILKKLGRSHCSEDTGRTIEEARRAGFSNISIDLIFGIPLQRESDVLEDTRYALSQSPAHISVYALSVEEGTPLFEEVRGGLHTPSDDEYASHYWKIKSILEESGYLHYETSNFAKKDSRCLHNMGYWSGKEYIAFGASASGHLKRGYDPGGVRYTNYSNMGDYLRTIDRGQLPRASYQEADPITAWKERLIMGLRLTDGFSLEKAREELGEPPGHLMKKINYLLSKDLLLHEGDHLKIPMKYVFTSNEILQHLV